MTGDPFKETTIYQIKVQGRLDKSWVDWFDGLAVVSDGETSSTAVTTLTGAVDQAALRGILTRIWDLNLTLISVTLLERSAV